MKNLTELIAKYGDEEIDETKFKELFDIKDSKVFIPKLGERYWFINEEGGVATYLFDNDTMDRGIIKYSGVYRTKEEAEFACDAQAFKVKMKRDFAENSDEIDWDDGNQVKYALWFAYSSNKILTSWWRTSQYPLIYTTNLEWLKQYVKDNEADIKKYVFEIKEDE